MKEKQDGKIHRAKTRKRKHRKLFSLWGLFKIALIAIVIAAVFLTVGYIYLMFNGEQLLKENLAKLDMPEATIVYDANGEEISRYFRENRDLAKVDELPELLVQAFVAKEDQRFYEHEGLDFWAIGRAVVTDIMHGSYVQGGSTITQQLAKNLFLNADKTMMRKASEAAIAVALENNFNKDEIMQQYLNTIFFGHQAYGVKAASKLYFSKDDLSQLELWEIATLAAIPKAPSLYNPWTDAEKSKQQRQIVLRLMQEQGYITEEERAAAAEVDYVRPDSVKVSSQQAFLDYALQEVNEQTGLTEEQLRVEGYRIYTTLNPTAQEAVSETMGKDDWYTDDSEEQKVESAMVILDHQTGAIQALYGGRAYTARGTNWALEKRQPGSSIKPVVVYAPALETDLWQPYSMLSDELTSYGGYKPQNYDHKYEGEVTMIDALRVSKNTSAVWLLQQMGIDTGLKYAESVGIEIEAEDRNLAIALGGMTYGVSPLQMAQAYTPFASEGTWTEAFAVLKVEDSKGRVIYEHESNQKQVLSKQTAYEMTYMLEQVVQAGSGRNAQMDRAVAGKTGTTQVGLDDVQGAVANRDVWFVGYTPEWTAAIWLGFPQTDTKHYLKISSNVPSQMFAESMTNAMSGMPVTSFVKPDDVDPIQTPPDAPDQITVEYDESNQAVVIEWSEVSGVDQYELHRKNADDAEFDTIMSVNPIVHDLMVEAGNTYEYFVVAVDHNTDLKSKPSNIVSIQIPEEEENTQQELDDLLHPDENTENHDSSDDSEVNLDEGTLEDEEFDDSNFDIENNDIENNGIETEDDTEDMPHSEITDEETNSVDMSENEGQAQEETLQ